MIQRKYLVFGGGLLLIALLWTAGWFWLAQRVQADIGAFAAVGKADPIELAWDSISVTGYPVRLNARLVNPSGIWPGPDRRITWRGADTVIGFFSRGSRTFSFRAPGDHVIDIQEPRGRFTLDTQNRDLRGELELGDDGRIQGLRGVAEGVTIRVNEAPSAAAASAAFDWSLTNGTATPGRVHPETVGQTVAFVLTDIEISDADLDPNVSGVLGNRIARIAGGLSLRGTIEPGEINADTLARWRDEGGTLELENVDIAWGPVRFSGEGTLALDQALQPVGALTAGVTGLDRLVDLLEKTGEMQPSQAAIARIALAVLTRAPANGGPPQARVPVSIQDSLVSIGPVPLMKLPPIGWN